MNIKDVAPDFKSTADRAILDLEVEPFKSMLAEAVQVEEFREWFVQRAGFAITFKHGPCWFDFTDDEYQQKCIDNGLTRAQAKTSNIIRRNCHARIVRYYHAWQNKLPAEHPFTRHFWATYCDTVDDMGLGFYDAEADVAEYVIKHKYNGTVIRCNYATAQAYTQGTEPNFELVEDPDLYLEDLDRSFNEDNDDDDEGLGL